MSRKRRQGYITGNNLPADDRKKTRIAHKSDSGIHSSQRTGIENERSCVRRTNETGDCEELTGTAWGQKGFISWVNQAPSGSDMLFTLKQRRFSARLVFAMTINKSQDQAFQEVENYLPNPVFDCNQLYAAFSRASNKDSIKVKIFKTRKRGTP